ncbi:DUF72 domain-containing protein [Pelomicrobium methylotrophicum]|uniref:DUF72 domain-containing protein n=1 Tax=Pelomicrobium methylotrophicum TaxID=2602750 RepID=A0A5C7F089_9PROT|nr:DUF72 domain-containing protein [Pelomicrobium methylotrophicum]TXF12851.1 DUF72 domain-containing protein [Pelomicrobium methylotrophicum]
MAAAPTYRIHVGAVDWEHPQWVGSFYPEDLPAEWRLAYYNQWFDCVLVPAHRWMAAAAEELARWRADTLDRFRFVLETGPQPVPEEARARAASLGPKLGMWYPTKGGGGPRLEWLLPGEDMKQLAARLRALAGQGHETYLIGQSPDAEYLNRVVTLLELLRL